MSETKKPTTYADKLKAPPVAKPDPPTANSTRNIVTIHPYAGSEIKSSDATEATLMCFMAHTKEKLQICGVRKIANNDILIETTTKVDIERLLKNEKL